MKNEDKFDLYIRNELLKSTQKYDAEGFRQSVLEKLPKTKYQTHIRSLIIYISGISACLLYFLIIDKNIILDFITEFFLLIYKLVIPSTQTILFVLIFTLIFYIIPKMEFRDGIS